MDGIGSREIAAGVEPAHLEGESRNAHRKSLAHDVSILPGVGCHLGSRPRANTSMTIMRAPQQGHGDGSTRGVSGATSTLVLLPFTLNEIFIAKLPLGEE